MDKVRILFQGRDTHIFIPLRQQEITPETLSPPSLPPVTPTTPVPPPGVYNLMLSPIQGKRASIELCVCCLTNPSTYLIPNCGHLCLCETCRSVLIAADHPQCPLCRASMNQASSQATNQAMIQETPTPKEDSKKDKLAP